MWPSTSTTPSDGVRIPASTWSSVLLPAPLGPMTPSDSPWMHRERGVAQRPEVRVAVPAHAPDDRVAEGLLPRQVQAVLDAEPVGADHDALLGGQVHRIGGHLRHSTLANVGSARLNT